MKSVHAPKYYWILATLIVVGAASLALARQPTPAARAASKTASAAVPPAVRPAPLAEQPSDALASALAAHPLPDVNPSALKFTLPDKIKWDEQASGAAQAIMAGDPTKPGLYVVLTRWHAHHMSRPHFHPNDRYIVVLSGTWWVGTGPKYDPDSTVAMPTGTFVTHYAKQIHYDGAKDSDVTLEIVGMGPATSTPAEEK